MVIPAEKQQVQPITIYYQTSTTNQSFMDMHFQLKQKGLVNNRFFLALYDRDLIGVDPRDPRLPQYMKAKVLNECAHNYWYFIREVIRIPDQGGAANSGVRYKLHRGNLALSFCLLNNWNIFLELPRQHGKTMAALCWYLWVFNFRTTNSEIMFMNKKHDDSKMNLQRLKTLRAALPTYLQFTNQYGKDGTKLRASNTLETITHIINNNKITTKPSARSKTIANNLGRGCTMPMHWYDEYAFIAYNKIIYQAATPAYKTASENAKKNHAPYGILITTTPGDLSTDEGMDAYETRNSATPFLEEFYDYTPQQLKEVAEANTDSSFFYIRFTYQQLGSSEQYFKEMVRDLKKDWAAIRREVLLEWSLTSDNSPFDPNDLELIATMVREPIRRIVLRKGFAIDLYKQIEDPHYPPIIGVDVSGGYSRDSSAITIIDSKTTDVVGDFNCNYISTNDLAHLIYELVVKFMPNAIVNVERSGGFGASVLSTLKETKIKRNLYYEIKDRIFEERTFGGMNQTIKRTQKCKVYGFDETKNSRDLLMQILRERVDNHKSKFLSPKILAELRTLEYKKNGRIEHTAQGHDDQIFSYLMAMYVWYEGKELTERFGLQKVTIHTDEDDEDRIDIDNNYTDISEAINEESDMVQEQLDVLSSNKAVLYDEWRAQEKAKDQEAVNRLLQTKIGQQAYIEKYHIDPDDLPILGQAYSIPQDVFDDYYDDFQVDPLTKQKLVEEERLSKIYSMKY